jgi:hypothetical protein
MVLFHVRPGVPKVDDDEISSRRYLNAPVVAKLHCLTTTSRMIKMRSCHRNLSVLPTKTVENLVLVEFCGARELQTAPNCWRAVLKIRGNYQSDSRGLTKITPDSWRPFQSISLPCLL